MFIYHQLSKIYFRNFGSSGEVFVRYGNENHKRNHSSVPGRISCFFMSSPFSFPVTEILLPANPLYSCITARLPIPANSLSCCMSSISVHYMALPEDHSPEFLHLARFAFVNAPKSTGHSPPTGNSCAFGGNANVTPAFCCMAAILARTLVKSFP